MQLGRVDLFKVLSLEALGGHRNGLWTLAWQGIWSPALNEKRSNKGNTPLIEDSKENHWSLGF